jgi:hypothetical protein
MDSRTMVLLGGVAFVIVMMIVLFYSVGLQRKAVGTQDTTVSKVDESLALARESVQIQKDGLAVARESLELQKETNRLLAALTKQST